MTDPEQLDAQLAALLSLPDARPDEGFVARMERVVLAEQRIAAARARAWRRFRAEAAASGAIIATFWLLWRLVPAEIALEQMPVAPAAAAIFLLFLWFAVELRPAASGR